MKYISLLSISQLVLLIFLGQLRASQNSELGWGALFKVTPSGQIATIASGATFMGPERVAIKASGDFIVIDFEHTQAMHTVTSRGEIGTLNLPVRPGCGIMRGLAIDSEGNYIVGSCSDVYRFSPDGSYKHVVDLKTDPGIYPYYYINDLVLDSSGNYLCSVDYDYATPYAPSYWGLLSITPDGDVTRLYEADSNSPLYSATVIAVTAEDSVIIATESTLNRDAALYRFDGNMTHVLEGAPLENITGIAIDGSSNIIITDSGHTNRATGMIFRITQDGAVSIIAGGSPPLMSPSDISLDNDGNYIVTDSLAGPPLYTKMEKTQFNVGEYLYMDVVVQPIAKAFDAWGIIESPSGVIYSFILNRYSPWPPFFRDSSR